MSWLERLGRRVRDVLTGDSPARREYQAELEGGWTLERDGRVLAHLSGWNVPDQFWHEFDVAIVTDRAEEQAAMQTDAFWDDPSLTLRSAHSGRVVTIGADGGPIVAIEQGRRFREERVLALRGL
jgi:hypothetical protein